MGASTSDEEDEVVDSKEPPKEKSSTKNSPDDTGTPEVSEVESNNSTRLVIDESFNDGENVEERITPPCHGFDLHEDESVVTANVGKV